MNMDAARAAAVPAGVAVSAILATVVVLVIGLGTIADDTTHTDQTLTGAILETTFKSHVVTVSK